MFGVKEPEVLVVGAGPVGLSTALCLARRGVRVQVIDKLSRTGVHSYALALHHRTLVLLEEMGLDRGALGEAHAIHWIGVHDDSGERTRIQLPEHEGGLPPLAVMPQDAFERLLEEALLEQGVRVLWNHAVSRFDLRDDRVSVFVDRLVEESMGYAVAHTEWIVEKSARVDVPFVVGADGHRSTVRSFLGAEFPQVVEPQNFAVFEFDTDAQFDHGMHLVLTDRTTNVLWPLPNGRCRWSFQLMETSPLSATRRRDRLGVMIASVQYPAMSERDLRTLLAERAPWFRGSIGEIHWQIVVRFERRLASSFGRDRVWLAGDAGHMTGPVGGQSMNVGIQEAVDLSTRLATVLREPGRVEILDSYSRERIAEWTGLLGLERRLQPSEATVPWVRTNADRLLPCIPASGPDLESILGDLGLSLRGC